MRQARIASMTSPIPPWEFFVQDSWKATRKLTVELGVRFSHFTPWEDREGYGYSIFNLAQFAPSCAAGLLRVRMALQGSLGSRGLDSQQGAVLSAARRSCIRRVGHWQNGSSWWLGPICLPFRTVHQRPRRIGGRNPGEPFPEHLGRWGRLPDQWAERFGSVRLILVVSQCRTDAVVSIGSRLD